jgi:hypothetical protein
MNQVAHRLHLRMNVSRFLAAAAVALLPLAARAAPACEVKSDALVRPLVELYTSEGCDSCPPADRWLAANFPRADRGTHAIALAFHVDYWDRLGWVDRFASASYTERQYAAMRANRASFVYTPQVLLQGRDLPGWRGGSGVAAIDAAARKPARAVLTLAAMPSQDAVGVRVVANVGEAPLRADAELFVAYADGGLHSDVDAGENRGVRLAHEHVVRALRRIGAQDAQGRVQGTIDIAKPREAGVAPTLVAFVQRRSNGDVLQAVALPLDGCAN